MTVRGVLNTLVSENLLERVPGKGTFVTNVKVVAQSPAYQGIREQLEAKGFVTETEHLLFDKVCGPAEIRDQFTLTINENLYVIARV